MEDLHEACFHCAEPISLDAQVCPHCRRAALVHVSLVGPVQDARLRYKVARSLAALGPPLSAFSVLQQALAGPRPVVAPRVARGFARRIVDTLAAEGITAEMAPAELAEPPRLIPPAPRTDQASPLAAAAWALVFVSTLVASGWYLWLLYKKDRSTASSSPAPAASSAQTAGTAQPETPALTTRQIAERSLSSTVSLRCPNSIASGFFVAPELILTNAHALCSSGVMKVVLSDGRETTGFPERTDRDNDLATLRVTSIKGPPATLGDAGSLAVGDKVVMIGSPVGLEFTVHEGSVSSLSRSIQGVAFIQIDAKINPGNSGGPLLDDHGRVVGVVSRKHTLAEGIGLALPINYAYRGVVSIAVPFGGAGKGFEAMVARAKAENLESKQKKPGDKLPDRGMPMLVATSQDSYHRVVVHVALPAHVRPEYRKLALDVKLQNELLCTVQAEIYEWTLFEGNKDLASIRPELLPAIRRRAQFGTLYLGSTALSFDRCPTERMRWQSVATLAGADPEFASFGVSVH
jgi:S1-C subfamily serine protease